MDSHFSTLSFEPLYNVKGYCVSYFYQDFCIFMLKLKHNVKFWVAYFIHSILVVQV